MNYGNGTPAASLPNKRDPYQIRRIGRPDALAVSLEEMKLSLRVDSDDEDLTIERLIGAATDYFEKRTGWVLRPATYEALIGPWCRPFLTIERGPFRSITGLWWWDCETREWTQVSPTEFQVEERGNEFDVLVSEDAVADFPAPTALRPMPIRLQFEAGFDAIGETESVGLPEDGMIVALKGIAAVGFENREAGAGAGTWAGADPAKDFWLQSYRKFW